MLVVAKCNLGKVDLKAILVSGFPAHILQGSPGILLGVPHNSSSSCLLAVFRCVTYCFLVNCLEIFMDPCSHAFQPFSIVVYQLDTNSSDSVSVMVPLPGGCCS